MKGHRAVGICVVAILALTVFASLFSGSVYAITGNYMPDEGKHPYVCLVAFYDENEEFLWRTTGSLLSSTVVLTAGHGTDGAEYAAIWVDEEIVYDPDNPDPDGYPNLHAVNAYEGVPFTMPGFGYHVGNNGLFGFIANDVGIVMLSEPVPEAIVSEYGDLPSVGVVDGLRVGTGVTFVGYGVQYQVKPKNNGGPYGAWTGDRARFYTTAQLLSNKFAISDTFIQCSANAAQGKGGTAFGDSGGPVLLGDSDTILAVTSFGPDANCAAVGYYCRIDTPEVLGWIVTFL